MTTRAQPLASVVICTRNRADSLQRCLQSLAADPSTASAEIIVVDNGSTDHTLSIVREYAQSSVRPVRLVIEPTPGLSRARNSGVATSAGRFILFTDDDVTVEPGWLDAIVTSFTTGVAAVGGRIVPRFLGARPRWLEGYDAPLTLIDYGEKSFDMSADRLPLGANMAIDGELLRDRTSTPFNEQLGHTGRVGFGYEETHLLLDLAATERIVYVPDARVDHWIEASRCKYPAVRRSFYQLGFGLGRHQRLRGTTEPSYARKLVRMVRCLHGAFKLQRRNARSDEVDNASAKEEFWAFMWAGLHVELVFGASPRLTEWLAQQLPPSGFRVRSAGQLLLSRSDHGGASHVERQDTTR